MINNDLEKPVVSIIMPAFNASMFIEDAILSVINQSYTKWELIIVNDNSNDNTQKFIDKYTNDPKIITLKNTNSLGAARSRNLAIKISNGSYLAFLDSDDLWDRQKLEIQMKFMMTGNIKFSFSSYRVINEHGKIIGFRQSVPSQSYQDLLKHNKIGCLTAVFKKDCLNENDLFMPEIKMRQDYALWLKILKHRNDAYGIHDCLASYRSHSSSLSHNKFRAVFYTWKLYRNVESINFIHSLYYFIYNVSTNILLSLKRQIDRNIGIK